MVIDMLKHGQERFLTSELVSCRLSGENWDIKFRSSATIYHYRRERIVFLSNPLLIDTIGRGVYVRNKRLDNILELYRFDDGDRRYYHVIFNGCTCDYDEKEIYISAGSISERTGAIWDYLQQCAKEKDNELTDGEESILERQYNIVDVMRDNTPLAVYVGKKKQNTYRMPERVIYPFGCNESQKTAVEKALTNQISIIQGPPGTGKTQTILNIIANLLMAGKSVLVVSNNNSAVENVGEKLSDESVGLGFLIAKLGKRENVESFIKNQSPLPDNLGDWIRTDISKTEKELDRRLHIISDRFKIQTKLALLKKELGSLEREARYDSYTRDVISTNNAEWLTRKTSRMLIALKCNCEKRAKQRDTIDRMFCFMWMFRFGVKVWRFLHKPVTRIMYDIDAAYYFARIRETRKEIKECEAALEHICPDTSDEDTQTLSLQILRHKVASNREGVKRREYCIEHIRYSSDVFLNDYPIVLSTTYMARSCIGGNMIFDYVIMDEASQVDITTGVLSLASAASAVIVGDSKQLHRVQRDEVTQALEEIEDACGVSDCYRSSKYSFLQSCCMAFIDAPATLLCEHYRCHPKIIEFCNTMFYDGKLITMTQDAGEDDVMKVLFTGKIAHNRCNQAEIREIKERVLPDLTDKGSIGIITPYRNQAETINKQLNTDIASTIHKYQGRECDNIVMSMVDNKITDFSDDPNLLNVAVSRTKSKLIIITNKGMSDYNSNIGKLIEYIRYNNFEINESPFYFVFDILYSACSEYYESKKKNNTDIAECIVLDKLRKYLSTHPEYFDIKIIRHYPLSRLVGKGCVLDDDEKQFVCNKLTHVDFLMYSNLTKRPILCIETDGWNYHQSKVQQTRDKLKNAILSKCNIPLIRWSTDSALTEEDMFRELNDKLSHTL